MCISGGFMYWLICRPVWMFRRVVLYIDVLVGQYGCFVEWFHILILVGLYGCFGE
jgi:hypothetical protein